MCMPALALTAGQAFAASLAAGAVTSAVSYVGQRSTANAQAKYQSTVQEQQNDYIERNALAARTAYIEEAAATNIRMGQQQEAASEELQQLSRERLAAQGTAKATSESAGLSFDGLMRDFFREEGKYRNNVRRQLEWDMDEGARQISGLRAKAQGRSNSVTPYTPQPVSSPSLLGAFSDVAGTAIDAFTRYGDERYSNKYKL